LPILEEANAAVKKIDKNMIIEVKSFQKPPSGVLLVLGAVCLLFSEKEDWDTGKKLISKMNFLDSLLTFQSENVPEKKWHQLKEKYLKDPMFTKEKLQAQSLAGTTLLIWVVATEKYAQVVKVIEPKKNKLKAAET
jgi:dynein heavy chain